MSDVGFIIIDTYYSMCYTVRGGTKMKSFSSREIIKLLKKDGWYKVAPVSRTINKKGLKIK